MGTTPILEFVSAPPGADGSTFRIHVIYTTPRETRESVRIAGLLARDLGASLEILAPLVVPYPLPLNRPTAPASFTERSLAALVDGCDVDVDVKILLCRDREETIPRWLPPESVAVIGRRRRWGPGSSRGLIRAVRRNGHQVVVVEADHCRLVAAAPCRSQVGS